MKRHILIALTLGILAGAASAQNTNIPPKTDFSKIFKSDKDKFSYAIGMYWAGIVKTQMARQQELDYDASLMAKALNDSLTGKPTLVTDAQQHEIMADLNREMKAKVEEKRKKQDEENRMKGERNLVDGPAFLAKNKADPAVVTLPSGLQYKVLTEGSGPTPKMGDEVSVNYRGTLIDGTEFDASARRGQPLNIKVMSGPSGVIKGWIEALQLMKTGSKWKIFVPADLAYGSQARPPQIAPNSVLIFELELLSIKPAPSAMAVRPAMAAAAPVTVAPAGVTATPVAPAAPAAPAAPVVPVVPVAPTLPPAPLTSDIIRVPSAEEMKKGAKIETIKPEDLEKEKAAVKP